MSGWRGVLSSCKMGLILLISSEPHLKRWKPPIITKNPCVFNHRRSSDESEELIRIAKYLTHLHSHALFSEHSGIVESPKPIYIRVPAKHIQTVEGE